MPNLTLKLKFMEKMYFRAKKICFLFLLALFCSAPLSADVEKKVVLQAFWWDYWHNDYPNSYANYLTELAPRLKELDINAVWVPPFFKNPHSGSVGYSPFDHYDLGDKYQKGSNTTRFGTKDEVLRMIAVMHANGIEVIEDAVLNHVDGAGSEKDGNGGEDPGARDNKWKNFRYVSYDTPATDGSESDYWSRSGRWAKNWPNFHPNQAHDCNTGDWCSDWWGPDICYYEGAYGQSSNAVGYNPTQSANYMRNQARDWLIWFTKQTAVDGYRWDAVKHFPEWAQQDFVYNVKYSLPSWCAGGEAMFNVGEFIDGKSRIDQYCNDVKYANGGSEFLMGAYDVPLRGTIKNIVSGGGYANLSDIPGSQLTMRYENYATQKVHRSLNYVNSHDTFRPEFDEDGKYIGWDGGNETGGHIDPFDKRLGMAYAIAMALDGNISVYMEDLFNLSNGKRWTHDPKNEEELPVRDAVKNLIWCHQNLDFKYGDYKVRWQDGDLLIVERAGNAIIAITDNGASDREEWIDTDFRNVELKDYSGGVSGNRTAYADGRFCAKVTNTGTGLGYSVWAPANKETNYTPYRSAITVQEWEMANDLGDSHCESLGQGGALPENSTAQRLVGKIYAEKDKELSIVMHPADEGNDITLAIYDLDGNALSKANGTQDVTLTYTPTQAGWIAIKIWNNSTNNIAQKAWVKATYEAPAVVTETMSDVADTRASIWTGNKGTTDWTDCANWEQGMVPTSSSIVVIPDNGMVRPIINTNVTISELIIEKGKGSAENPDIMVNATLNVTGLSKSIEGNSFICGEGAVYMNDKEGNFDLCATEVSEINETSFSIFPNPATSQITITSDYLTQTELIIYDMSGRIVSKNIFDETIANIDISTLSDGVYYVRLNGKIEKFIKR